MAPISADAGRLQGVEQVAGKASLLHLLEAKSEGRRSMTEPTDAEAWEMWLAQPLTGHAPKSVGNFARAVLAKFGTPPAVAGEPFAWADDGSLRSGSTATAHRVVTHETKMGMPKAAADSFNTPLYLTQQPTQAQAGAVRGA